MTSLTMFQCDSIIKPEVPNTVTLKHGGESRTKLFNPKLLTPNPKLP